MTLPSINQYKESVSNPEGLFRTLQKLLPCSNNYGEVIFISGNQAAIFRMQEQGKTVALKCYIRSVERVGAIFDYMESLGSDYIVQSRWLPGEIFVYENDRAGNYWPVSVSPWIEGETLYRYVKRLCKNNDRKSLEEIAGKFDRMALWLLDNEFAHGDLKHDNILVENGNLKLIDFDGAFIPGFENFSSPSLGSPAYQHPYRNKAFFDRHLDDYSIALISLSLHALAEDPSLFSKYNDSENLILNASEIFAGRSALFEDLRWRWIISGNATMLSLSDMLLFRSPQLKGLRELLGVVSGLENLTLTCEYQIIDAEDTRMALVERAGKFGYADLPLFKVVIMAEYDDAEPFKEGLAPVRLRGRRMYIDTSGAKIIDAGNYHSISPFCEGLARVGRDGKFGYIDTAGQEAIPVQYSHAMNFRSGRAAVCINNAWFYIDSAGEMISDRDFDSLQELKRNNCEAGKN